MVVVTVQFIFLGGCAVAVAVAASAASAHATSAADAVAHATVAELASDPGRRDFAVALQSGTACVVSDDGSGRTPLRDGNDDPVCHAALETAQSAASANSARLLHISIGPDPRAFVAGEDLAQFEVLVETMTPGPLAGTTPLCNDHQSRHDYCWALAWSAAREAG